MNILSRICDIRPRVKYMMSRIRDNRPMSVNMRRSFFFCLRERRQVLHVPCSPARSYDVL